MPLERRTNPITRVGQKKRDGRDWGGGGEEVEDLS